nr:immunoglobulin heavy chain junction region [Mus musculus]
CAREDDGYYVKYYAMDYW